MNCELSQQRLIEDLAHRCDKDIEAHLEDCSECRQLCDDLLALEELARSLGNRYRVPEDFGMKVLAHRPRGSFSSLLKFRPILVPLVIVMLSFGFFWLHDGASARDELFVAEEVVVVDTADWEETDSAYIEVVIEDPHEGEMMLHLPSVIEIHRTELHEDFHYQNTGY
jgi:predicted anti-sigma-YlaC factor YlaD